MSEAALNSEGDEEADYSSVPDMILLNPGPDDIVVGVSSSSFFVCSALAYAKQFGAATLMLQGDDSESAHAWNWTISLSRSDAIPIGIQVQKFLYCLAEAVLFQMQVVRQPGY